MKKRVLFLANGFGIEGKDSYSLGDDLTPNVIRLSQEYMFNTTLASGKECGFLPNQSSTYQFGYQCFSEEGYCDLAVRSMDKKIYNKTFINDVMRESIDFAANNKSKMHIFFMIGDKFSYSTGDQLSAFVKECIDRKVKEVCIHLFIGYNSEKGLKTAKDSIKAVTRSIAGYDNVNISLIVGVDLVSDSTPISNLSKLYKIATTSVSETWADWQSLFETRYKQGISDENFSPFLLKRKTLFESNDSIFIFNYALMPISRYLSIIVNPNQLYTSDKNPTNIKITSLLPINEKGTLAHAYEYDLPDNYFALKLKKLGKSVTLLADSSRATYINSVLNGNKNEISPQINTKSVRIANDYFGEMTQVLLNEIQNGQDEVIIIDYDLAHNYKKGEVETLKENFRQMDKALRKVYEYTYKNHHMLIFTSLYGLKDSFMLDNKDEVLDYSKKVPVIVIDDEYSKNTASMMAISIAQISSTILYLLGDANAHTFMTLKKRSSKATNRLIILGGVLFCILYVLYLVFLKK